MSVASLSETQQQFFKRCHSVCPKISHSWPSVLSHPSCEDSLGCWDESMITINFIAINFFVLQGSASCSTSQPYAVCMYLNKTWSMYSLAELKEKKAWQFYLVYSDNSRLIWQFPSDAAADQAFFLLKLMELNRLNSSRETRLDKKLESSFEIICVFPLEKKKKRGCMQMRSLPFYFRIANLKCLIYCVWSWVTRENICIQTYTALSV